MSQQSAMLEAYAPVEAIRRSYNRLSRFYAVLVAPFESKARQAGLAAANIQPTESVLEVAVGPGLAFVEILKRVDKATPVYGVDLSPRMLDQTARVVRRAGYRNVDLREADARQLPFADNTFDVLLNNYMLDLIPLADMPVILSEFRRVLKPGGRLILVNMSKPDSYSRSWLERLYRWLPNRAVPGILGGCRPVLMEEPTRVAGFQAVTRRFLPNAIPSELVTAQKQA